MTKIAPFPQPNFSIWLWFLTIFRVSVPPVISRKIAKRVIFCSSWPVETVLSKFSKNLQLLILGQQYTLSNSIKCSFWHCYCHCVCLSLCHCHCVIVIVIVSLRSSALTPGDWWTPPSPDHDFQRRGSSHRPLCSCLSPGLSMTYNRLTLMTWINGCGFSPCSWPMTWGDRWGEQCWKFTLHWLVCPPVCSSCPV